MPYTVEGEEIDPEELEDGTWVTPKPTQGSLDPLDLQHKYSKAASKPAEARPEHASTSALHVQATRPPKLPRRRPMPRLPSEHYKIVIRPRHPINLANIGLAAILEAIQSTAKVDPARAEEEDQIRIHPIKNTITVSTPDRTRAEAYRSLEVLKSLRYNMNLPVATYVPAPDDSIRGVVYKAYTDETDHDFQAELMKKNPDIPIVNARRLGSSRHLVITLAGKKLPATIRFSRSRSRERSTAKPAMNNKNAWSNGPPKNVAWTTDVSGQTRKEATTQPAHNTTPARPQDIQVRELAELVKSLQQQLASANEHIRQLENNYNSTTTPPAPEEQVACAQSEVTDMETDRIRGEKRKASSPAPETATEEKREKVKNSTLRIAKLETAINARFKELEAKQAEFQAATEDRLTRIEAAMQNMLRDRGGSPIP
ncbi:hypothetical protein HPB49_016930 [Dermacentor silvarum]|uniref:Uncharacterized protein n=1 Tax=Dermacentor silvarum TaxID=543639 RepID=A0ACB8CG85_DERSI|nr:hypothetical protein HPB49_016930 [Dermacentor silvarum]